MRTGRRLRAFAIPGWLFSLLLLTGCFETDQEFTLNPDGSGKVVHESTFPLFKLDGDRPLEELLADEVRELIVESQGVEVWRDVTWRILENGRAQFRGTAYFTNLSRLELSGNTPFKFDWTATGGEALLGVRRPAEDAGETDEPDPADPDERAKQRVAERARLEAMMPMLKGVLDGMRYHASFHLPGEGVAASNFKTLSNGAFGLTMQGTNVIRAFERMMASEQGAAILSAWHSGAATPEDDTQFNEYLFGTKAPVQLSCRLREVPMFDYAAEVCIGREELVELRRRLGIGSTAVSVAPPADGSPLLSAKVVGTKLVTLNEGIPSELRPFGQSRSAYSLAIMVEFTGRIFEISGMSLDPAVADDGTALLKPHRVRGSFADLSADATRAIFELDLTMPGPNAKFLRQVSGRLDYLVSNGTKEIDLGIDGVKSGSKGTELGAAITDVRPGLTGNGTEFDVAFHLPAEAFDSISMRANGVDHPLTQQSLHAQGSTTRLTLETDKVIPEGARLVVRVHDDIRTFSAPFSIENVSLLQVPAEQAR